MPYGPLDPKKTGLLFFDPLNVYYKGADESVPRPTPPVVDNYVKLAAKARQVGIAVFYAKGDPRADGRDSVSLLSDTDHGITPWPDPDVPHLFSNSAARGAYSDDWAAQIIEEIKPQPGDYVIPKHRWGAFYQTHLELSLRTAGIDSLILCGGSLDVGIVATAFPARDMDFNLIIVRDACTGRRQEVFDMLMDQIFPRMARIRTTEEVLKMMEANG